MEISAYQVDDQPISASFFGEGRWLRNYITPDEPDIQVLYSEITKGLTNENDKIVACWKWVAALTYKPYISASINVEGKSDRQLDYWQTPSMCARTGVGNCANKSFLLTSLLRNFLPPDRVHCVFGNLHNGHAEGHAWPEVTIESMDYIVESTRGDVPMIPTFEGARYEPIHYFNDEAVYAVPGRTLMVPFSACFSTWLKDYLDDSYINYMRRTSNG